MLQLLRGVLSWTGYCFTEGLYVTVTAWSYELDWVLFSLGSVCYSYCVEL